MNENAKKWISALRSGEYKQSKRHLQNKDGYCCLGVACDLYQKAIGGKWVENTSSPFDGIFHFETGIGSDWQILPVPVQDWLGMRDRRGEFYIGSQEVSLTTMNDNGADFIEIANTIETHPEKLFV